jgi:type IV secretory pathway TraG/TraD family ATPase VirD4
MKLKFSADSKDITIFVLFAIFLLYLIAIGVLNFTDFAATGKGHGFNPLPAFSKNYFYPTMVFYIIALIAIIASVSSHFFERESGFGISSNKNTKGHSRWAKSKEMKKILSKVYASDANFEAAGIPVISDGNEIYVDNGESHTLIIGTTGSGKTRRLVDPLIKILAKKGESMILTDPKGELYDDNANLLIERGYKIVVLNLRNPQQGNAWNPLQLPYQLYKNGNPDKAMELLDDLAINILYEENSGNADPFWEKTSADYFSGLALGLFEDAKESQININSINLMTTVGEEKFGGGTYIKEYFTSKDPSKPAYINASSTILAPSETKGSILAVFKQKIKLYSSKENLSEMLSYSDFKMKDFGKEKTAVFIIIQDEKKTYHPLATTFVKQCYETLIDEAQECGGKLPVRMNFILDEFANMPPLKDVTTMITAARSRQIRFNLIIQNFAQLNQVYGKENAETIKGNCANTVYLLSSELGALEEISKLCGEEAVKDKDAKGQTKPLISVNELQRLKMGDAIINKHRMHPFKTKLPDKSEYKFNIKNYDKAKLPLRDKKPLELFDIREFVKEAKRAKLFEMLEDNNSVEDKGFGQMNMGNPMSNPNMDFNVDDLVKKIDAKIAELEAEEAKEKEANKTSSVVKAPVILNAEPTVVDNRPEAIDLYINKNAVDNDDKEVTDDHFFDDFFDNDEE